MFSVSSTWQNIHLWVNYPLKHLSMTKHLSVLYPEIVKEKGTKKKKKPDREKYSRIGFIIIW